jgi:FkbM family methyltransferase
MPLSLSDKANLVLHDRHMFYHYLRWQYCRLLRRRQGPGVPVTGNIRLSRWACFSEYWLFRNGIPQSELQFMRRLLFDSGPTKSVVFDVGANVGLFTSVLAGLGAGAIHAFEPIPETFCRLRANLLDNKLLESCTLNCFGVGAGRDLVEFRFDERSASTSRIVRGEVTVTDNKSRHSVAIISLDEYCRLKGIERIDFLKIDVEGMEPYVLQGAHHLLTDRRVRAILIEVCPANLHSVGLTLDDLFQEIVASGYIAHELDRDGCAGRILQLEDMRKIELDNVVLVPGRN